MTPIFEMLPFDIVRMDYIGPIFPVLRNSNKYIIISVDYFSRFLLGQATAVAKLSTIVAFAKNRIVRPFGALLAFYCNNGKHFDSNEVDQYCEDEGIKMVHAPISHLALVGLSERFVQMILSVFCKILQT